MFQLQAKDAELALAYKRQATSPIRNRDLVDRACYTSQRGSSSAFHYSRRTVVHTTRHGHRRLHFGWICYKFIFSINRFIHISEDHLSFSYCNVTGYKEIELTLYYDCVDIFLYSKHVRFELITPPGTNA